MVTPQMHVCMCYEDPQVLEDDLKRFLVTMVHSSLQPSRNCAVLLKGLVGISSEIWSQVW